MGPRIRTDVSIVEDYLIHDLYICLELFGGDIKNHNTTLRNDFYSPIKEDTISCQFDLSGVTCDVFSSWRYPIKKREIIITGDKGSFIWVNDSLSISTDRYVKIDGKDSMGNVGYKLIEEGVKIIYFDNKSTLTNELQAFLDCAKPKTSILDVWNLIKVIKG
jgi:predicted dehydrogenase